MADLPAISDWHEDKIRRRALIAFERDMNLRKFIGPKGIKIHAVRRHLDQAGVPLESIGDADRPQSYPLMRARVIHTGSPTYPRRLYLKDDNESLVIVEWDIGRGGFVPISRTVDPDNLLAVGLLRYALLHA